MLATTLLLAAALAPQTPTNAPVVINEFSYDDSSTDDYEFVELYNRSAAAIDISGWTLQSFDETGAYGTTVIPVGTTLQPGDFWVIGMPAVPNLDQGLGTHVLDNGNETITLFDVSMNPQDSVTYEAWYNTHTSPNPEGQALFDNNTMIENDFMSWQRARDGHDTNNNGYDFRVMPWTPGTSNNVGATRFTESFDALPTNTPVAGWASSWVDPYVIDPTVVTMENPNAIPASPQGGNAVVMWDSAGGGDICVFQGVAGYDQKFEAYVYIDGTPLPASSATDWEAWSIGFGTEGNNFSVPDPGGLWILPPPTANGNTGFNWTVQRDSTSVTLFLVDNNDGGWAGGAQPVATPEQVITTIPIVPGQNDGWQRLLIEVSGNGSLLTAQYGGTYGQLDGTGVVNRAVGTPHLTGLFCGYREVAPGVPTQARPPTFDAITYSVCPPASVDIVGSGTTITSGTMAISASAAPVLNGTFNIDGANMQQGLPAVYAAGLMSAAPIDLAAIGGPADAVLRVDPLATVTTSVAAGGTSTLSVQIPNLTALCAVQVGFQIVTIDFNLPQPLKLGLSPALRATIGR
jgi:hypothetical protein